MFRAPHVLCEAGLLDAPVGGGPPASRTCCVLLLVAPLVFRAPSGPAAREIATREPDGSEWSISKPARALRSLRHPPHRRCLCCWCVAWCVVSMPGQALPPPTDTAAWPCGTLGWGVPRLGLFLSGVTPLSRVLHQIGGGVMLPNWCSVAQVIVGVRG